MENEEIVKEEKKKKFNLLKKVLKTTKSKIIFIIIIAVLVVLLGIVLRAKFFNKEASADFSYLSMLLEKSSEVTFVLSTSENSSSNVLAETSKPVNVLIPLR